VHLYKRGEKMSTMTHAVPHGIGVLTWSRKDRWMALTSSWLGYTFDVMDFLLYSYVGITAVAELFGLPRNNPEVAQYNSFILAMKLLCWSLGGIVFGILADRLGRKAVLTMTIVGYSLFTALSGWAPGYWWLFGLQAAAAFCVSGEWLSAMSIVAETWTKKERIYAGVFIQAAFAVGALAASYANLYIGPTHGWRTLMFFGALPALVLVLIRWFGLKDPDLWIDAKKSGVRLGSLRELFSPELRRNIVVNFIIVTSFLVAWYGGNAMLLPLISKFLAQAGGGQPLLAATSQFFNLVFWSSLPMYALIGLAAGEIGRKLRPLYMIYAAFGLLTSLCIFLTVEDLKGLNLLAPFYGCTVIAGFGLFGVFLPQAFPTRLRGAALGVVYNFGRAITGGILLLQATLIRWLGIEHVGGLAALAYVVAIGAVFYLPEDAPEE
jgi:predicted MFS family arabinose efflux permease